MEMVHIPPALGRCAVPGRQALYISLEDLLMRHADLLFRVPGAGHRVFACSRRRHRDRGRRRALSATFAPRSSAAAGAGDPAATGRNIAAPSLLRDQLKINHGNHQTGPCRPVRPCRAGRGRSPPT